MPAAQLADAIDQNHQALNVFLAGDPEPLKALYSRRDDITLANPFGPPVGGWSQVEQTMERAAELYRDGHATAFEPISLIETADLAYTVEIERYETKVAGASNLAPIAVRTTTIFRREDGQWRIAHRHADPTVSPQPPEIILGQA